MVNQKALVANQNITGDRDTAIPKKYQLTNSESVTYTAW